MKIPPDQLSEAALAGVIEAFVLREGTDYGEREVSFERKCAQVRAQLERGEVEICFDPHTESIDLRPAGTPPRRRPPEA